uniref:Prefoldin subunit 4 n=1 Tax=Strongyloides stercoralis TaxID=6248 RepID=A0A0K0E1K0_STRER
MSSSNLKVSKDDQDKINKFATGHAKTIALKREIEKLKTFLENCKEAEEEVMIVDSETIPYKVGCAFFELTLDEINDQIAQDTETHTAKLAEKESALEKITNELEKLKKELYAKFGNAINLEAD